VAAAYTIRAYLSSPVFWIVGVEMIMAGPHKPPWPAAVRELYGLLLRGVFLFGYECEANDGGIRALGLTDLPPVDLMIKAARVHFEGHCAPPPLPIGTFMCHPYVERDYIRAWLDGRLPLTNKVSYDGPLLVVNKAVPYDPTALSTSADLIGPLPPMQPVNTVESKPVKPAGKKKSAKRSRRGRQQWLVGKLIARLEESEATVQADYRDFEQAIRTELDLAHQERLYLKYEMPPEPTLRRIFQDRVKIMKDGGTPNRSI
jgi:hypothetical protein